MALRKVKLELARDQEFPDGSAERGYEFYAPLNAEGHLDREEWHDCADQCTVHRFWLGEGDERGGHGRAGARPRVLHSAAVVEVGRHDLTLGSRAGTARDTIDFKFIYDMMCVFPRLYF